MKSISSILGFASLVIGLVATAQASELELWQEILGAPEGSVPAADGQPVVWRPDFYAALEEAQTANKPLLVTWRCLPCQQCAEFDKEVLEGGASLTPLLQRYVTVRMTDAAALDERYFPYRQYQDLDLSWWGYLMSPEGRIYAIFGGKDHISDATRISEKAFVNTLERVLAHHHDPRRESWNIDGEAPETSAPKVGPKDNPGFATMAEKRVHLKNQECVHCHQVRDFLNVELLDSGAFTLEQFTQPWPFPENVGLVVDRDDGLLVTQVQPGSPAAKIGIQPGDQLAMAERRKLFGQADFRGALHRAPYGDASVLVGWTQDGEVQVGRLELEKGWREVEVAWRKSVYDGVYGATLGFFPIKGPNQGKGKMSFRPFMGPGAKAQENPWYDKGLRPNMEIVSVNGRSEDWNSRDLLAWFRLNHKGGDPVVLEVRQGGKVIKITGEAKPGFTE